MSARPGFGMRWHTGKARTAPGPRGRTRHRRACGGIPAGPGRLLGHGAARATEGSRGLDRERRPATGGALRVGVLDDELRALQAFLVVDLGAGEVLVAHRVDEQGDAVLLHHRVVVVLDLVEGEPVLEAGAAAARDEYPQLEVGIALLVDELLDLVGRAVAEQQRDGHLGYGIHNFQFTPDCWRRASARRLSFRRGDAPAALQPRRLDGFRSSCNAHPL